MRITDYTVRKLRVPIDPPISDSQFEFDVAGIAYLELETDTGAVGIGFGGASPDEAPAAMDERLGSIVDDLVGESPFKLVNQSRRPRGGQYPTARFGASDQAVDVALWDLCAKHLDLPLFELLGGTDPEVSAYASGLHFSLDDDDARRRFEGYADQGFDAAKVKVGYPTVEEDVDRLKLVREAMGRDVRLMVDANGAWTPKEAIRRLHAYRDAGLDVFWVEDPVLRDDVEGCRRVAEDVQFAHLNSGEYLNLEGKLELLEERAIDVLHLSGGMFSTARQEATLASAFGVPVAIHDAIGHVCVHLAAAVPELVYQEYWPRPWDGLVESGVEVDDGRLVAPDDPGHGVRFADRAFAEYGES